MKRKKPSAAGKTDSLTKAESEGQHVRNAKPGRDPKRRNPMTKGAKPKKPARAGSRGGLEKAGVSKKKMGRRVGARAGGSKVKGSRAHGTGLKAQAKAKGARSPQGVNAKRARSRKGQAHANEKPLEADITPIATSELAAATTTSPPEEAGEMPPPAAGGQGRSQRAHARKR